MEYPHGVRAARVVSKNQVIGGKKLTLALKAIEQKITNAGVLRVGFLEGAKDAEGMPEAQKAFWNEFGTIRIPTRPFFRSTIARESKTWGDKLSKAVVATNYDGQRALGLLGQSMRDDIESAIAGWSTPPNAPRTIAAKGFNKPLVHHGTMQRAVDYEVKPK